MVWWVERASLGGDLRAQVFAASVRSLYLPNASSSCQFQITSQTNIDYPSSELTNKNYHQDEIFAIDIRLLDNSLFKSSSGGFETAHIVIAKGAI
ncbi:unnamed protein product [Nezara viridula]|uniref:Uncharacterized protein n=1 Tax=Nezara viridula TaxID=85310 RepID=A0A9P0HH36_NEZVI|nr:unnamed protein product [Nezara viridula]